MKTPMQELIQSLKAEQMTASNEWQTGYQKALSNVIDEVESMLNYSLIDSTNSTFHFSSLLHNTWLIRNFSRRI